MTHPELATAPAAAPRVRLSESAVQRLRAAVRGELIEPEHAAYEEARQVYNAMHDRRPALIVHAAGVADILAVVRFAAEQGLALAVRGGGHSVPGFGTCDGGVVLDLRRLRGIRVDPARRRVRAEGGCTWGELDHATNAFGLATTGGVVSTTGIAGLTLGGGMGYLSRRCGLSCDNLVSADVVTADGRFVTCSETREEDLFWALRGGGGNFGVVTSFEYRLHQVGDIYGGAIFFPVEGDILRSFQDRIAGAPRKLGAVFAFTKAAPLPFLPAEWHGKPVCAVIACWSGAIERGEKAVAPLRRLGPVAGAFIDRMPYPQINTLFDELLPAGLRQYWKGNFVRRLTDEAIAAHVDHAARTPTIESGTFLVPIDGACHAVAPEATAFATRDARFSTVIAGAWPDRADDEANVRWVREYWAALRPHSEEGGYVNFMSADDQDRVESNYGGHYQRLVAIKSRYDPANLFRVNHNIRPLA
ncbi:MAG TPA: FAD-binding oxidoreductase [Thermoanaerobaculia bacterium]|nr:FAD-binding oxidoreductase [Thermoanaerobaculia bacterium]